MKPKWAECVFDWERGWTVVQSRYNGKENFNRPMKAYKNGFGCPVGDGRKWDNTHWLVFYDLWVQDLDFWTPSTLEFSEADCNSSQYQ